MEDGRRTYLLIDGENLDFVLGTILGRKPEPGQRPRWQQLVEFAERRWAQPVRALFFINATRGLHAPFVQALIAMGYRPVPLAGREDEKVVDIGIQRTLEALRDRPGDVVLGSHDADFVDGLSALADGERRLAVVGFPEMVSQALRDIAGIEVLDLESDAGAFEIELPRVRIIPLDEFDPVQFL
ncbi:MAG: NYN domain-containing protein [Actinobacteria bacterium]|nr:NYN domain-containing protein [Actinomycetota bacterium]